MFTRRPDNFEPAGILRAWVRSDMKFLELLDQDLYLSLDILMMPSNLLQDGGIAIEMVNDFPLCHSN